MVSMTHKQAVLVWDTGHQSDRRFNTIALGTIVICLAFSVVIARLPAPVIDRTITTEIPERIAKIMTEMVIPERPPEVKPQPEQAKPEDKIERPTPKDTKPQTKAEESARKTAQGSGLLVLSKQLSALADTSNINSMVTAKLNTAPTNTAAATVDTAIVTSDSGRKTVAVSQGAHVGTVGTTKLDDNQKRVTQALLEAGSAGTAVKPLGTATTGRGTSGRRQEEVAIVMDQNKGTLYNIYNRARRANPGLKGKLVLELTIQPSGQVSNIVIKSSELNLPELEASLVSRIRQFDFGKREGGPFTLTVPVEFLPS